MKHLIFLLCVCTLIDRAKQWLRCDRKFSSRPPWEHECPSLPFPFCVQMYVYPSRCTEKSVASLLLTICLGLSHGQSQALQKHHEQAITWSQARQPPVFPNISGCCHCSSYGKWDNFGTAVKFRTGAACVHACSRVIACVRTRECAWACGYTPGCAWMHIRGGHT